MPALAIRARFPLGVYLGHKPDGQASLFPDTARLFSALMHSAGKGSQAIELNGDLRPAPRSLQALQWMEDHAPSALAFPPSTPVAPHRTPTESYRDEGVFDTAQKSVPTRRKVRKHQSDAVAVAGAYGWAWDEDAPADIVDTIAALCEDVSCLGEADTPVILEVADIDATHYRDATDTAFPASGGVQVRTPISGRIDELEADYAIARPLKRLTPSQDRHTWTSQPGAPRIASSRVRSFTYRSPTPPMPDLPWVGAIAMPLRQPIDAHERVRWCVALHRAFAAYLGDLPVPLLTGRYAEEAEQPANRVALQYLEAEVLQAAGHHAEHGAFVVLAPGGAAPEDLVSVEGCIRSVRKVYRPGATAIDLGPRFDLDPSQFWPAPQEGVVRYWRPVPGMVTETRRQGGGSRWSLEDAALLSIGHVFRERLVPSAKGSERYRGIVEQVRSWGVRVHDVHPIHDSRVERFAHKLPQGVIAQPYTAKFDLAAVLPPTALVAVGQSRHLGAGLLVPVDESIASARALYGWGS